MTMYPTILKLDLSGVPVSWVSWRTAASLYTRHCVRWEAGATRFTVYGGTRGDGLKSSITLSSIIAVHDRSRRGGIARVPPLTNRALFARDGHVCLYCGHRFPASKLTRDHVVSRARGGKDEWASVVTACQPCNNRKADKSVEEAGMKLLAIPFTPSPVEHLLLLASGRRITADQQAWLESFAEKGKKLS